MIATLIFVLILFNVMIGFLFETGNYRLSRNLRIIIAISIFSLLTLLSVLIIPATNMDLYRYYARISFLRAGGWQYFRALMTIDPQVLFSLELYGISRTTHDELAPVISCIFVFTAFFYIYFDYTKRNRSSKGTLIISIGMLFAWLPYFQVIDNLRSPMSMAICAVCIYKQFVKHKNLRSQIIWYVIACLIHMQTIVVIAFVIAYTVCPQIYHFRYLLLFIGFGYSVIGNLLCLIPIPIIRMLAQKIIRYSSDDMSQANLYNEFTISRLFLFLFFASVFEIIKFKISNEESKKLLCLLQIITLFAIGNIVTPEVIRRFSYLFGFFGMIQIDVYQRHSRKVFAGFRVLVWLMILGMQFWAFLKLSRFTISGIDYSWIFKILQHYINF